MDITAVTCCLETETTEQEQLLLLFSKTETVLRGKTSPRAACLTAHSSPLGYSTSNTYSFREAGSGRPFTASGRYWSPRLRRTA